MAVIRRDAEGSKKPTDDGAEVQRRRGPIRWLAGWVLIPGLVIAGIFGSGMHLGANNPEAWYAEAVMWLVGLFSSS